MREQEEYEKKMFLEAVKRHNNIRFRKINVNKNPNLQDFYRPEANAQ